MERDGSRARVQAGSTNDGGGRVDTGRSEGAADLVGRLASRFVTLSELDERATEDEGGCLGDSDLEGHRIATSCVDGLFDTVVDTGTGGRGSQTTKQSGRGRGRWRGRGGTRSRARCESCLVFRNSTVECPSQRVSALSQSSLIVSSSPLVGTGSDPVQSQSGPGDQGWQLQWHRRGRPYLRSSRGALERDGSRARVQAGSIDDVEVEWTLVVARVQLTRWVGWRLDLRRCLSSMRVQRRMREAA
ncbi:hypothetical protein Dimus_033537 [Dionaea muscipula]